MAYSHDGKTKLAGAPTNAGTYTIKLNNDNVLTHLKDKIAHDPQWTVIVNGQTIHNVKIDKTDLSGSATFTISKANAQISLSDGTIQRMYTGSQIAKPVSDLRGDISASGLIGDDHISTSGLTADNFDWCDADGKTVTSSQVNVGTYYIQLNQAGINALEKGLTDNYNWSVVPNLVKMTVVPKNLNVSISSNGKIYDGDSVSDIKSQLQASGLTGKDSLNIAGLKDTDFTWTDASGKAMDAAPTNVGTYAVALTTTGLTQLREDNPNYIISGGRMTYSIRQAAAQVVINGKQTFTPTSSTTAITTSDINNSNYSASYINQYPGRNIVPTVSPASIFMILASDGTTHQIQLTLHDSDLTFVDEHGNPVAAPANPGDYYVGLTNAAFATLQQAYPNYNLQIGPVGFFYVKGLIQYVFQDAQNNNVQVGKTVDMSALPSDDEQKLSLTVPTGYKLSDGQTLPTSYTITNADPLVQTINISLVHGTTTVTPETPKDQIPDGKVPGNPSKAYDKLENLTKTITRTIIVNKPDGTQTTKYQTVEFDRNAIFDNVTGKATYSSWTAKAGNSTWAAYTPDTITGYVPSTTVESEEVTADTEDQKITINYIANGETATIIYMDGSKQVTTQSVGGKVDQTIDLDYQVPTNYELDGRQPKTYRFTATSNQQIIVYLLHQTSKVSRQKTINETVRYTGAGAKTPKDHVQSLTFIQKGVKDLVTGKITWMPVDGQSFAAVITPEVPGYVADVDSVPAIMVKFGDADITRTVTYTAYDQTGKLVYVNRKGKQISQTALHGKTGDDVTINPAAPAGWMIVPGQTIPTSVKATTHGIPTVTVIVEHKKTTVTPETPNDQIPSGKVPGDPSKNYPKMETLTKQTTRKIVVTAPNGTKKTTNQVVNFKRTATFDQVNGKVSYSPWTANGKNQWDAFTPDAITGYLPTVDQLAAVTVSGDTSDAEVDISYLPVSNAQTAKIIFVDGDNGDSQVEAAQTIHGKSGQQVALSLTIPAGYQLAQGQSLPTSYTFTDAANQVVQIRLVHHKTDISKTDANAKLNITRNIVVVVPDGTKATTSQVVTLKRTALRDDVTGVVTYGPWSNGRFIKFTTPNIPGYTPSQSEVAVMIVRSTTPSSTVTITYTPNEQSGKISYVDSDGNEVGQTPLSGKTDEAVAIHLAAPAGWTIVPGQDISTSVVATADGIPTVVVRVEKTTPTTPVHPTGPTTPTQPTTPTGPTTAPTQPTTPTSPTTAPTQPTQPTGPTTAPTQPTNPTGPTTAPTQPTQPTGPTTAPTQPTHPTGPTTAPTQPTTPTSPTTAPTQPTQPTNPTTAPTNSTSPAHPNQPGGNNNGDLNGNNGNSAHGNSNDGNAVIPGGTSQAMNNGNGGSASGNVSAGQLNGQRTNAVNSHAKTNILPQTGNDKTKASLFGFAFAGLAAMLGLAGTKKKKNER